MGHIKNLLVSTLGGIHFLMEIIRSTLQMLFLIMLLGYILILISLSNNHQQTQVQTQTIFQQLDGHRAPPSPLLDVAFVL